jgi:hypothetical protein
VQGDISAETMISGVEGVDPARRQMLIDMLDIDLSWWAACPALTLCIWAYIVKYAFQVLCTFMQTRLCVCAIGG